MMCSVPLTWEIKFNESKFDLSYNILNSYVPVNMNPQVCTPLDIMHVGT